MEHLKKNLILALGFGVAVYLVFTLLSGLDYLLDALGGFYWSLLALIFGLIATSYAMRFARWSYYLKLLKISLPLQMNVTIFAAGLSMTISPGKFGEVLKSVFIRQVNGTPIARTAPAVVAERVTDGTSLLAWGFIGALALGSWPWLLPIFLALSALGIAVLRSNKLSLLAEKALSKFPLVGRLAPHVRSFHGASNELLSYRPLLAANAISFLAWGLDCLGVYLCAAGIGVGTPFLVIVFIYVVSLLAGSLSVLPGGIGVTEAGMAGMLVAIAGLSSELSVTLTFVIRLATFWFATSIGVVGLLLARRLISETDGGVQDTA